MAFTSRQEYKQFEVNVVAGVIAEGSQVKYLEVCIDNQSLYW